MCIVILALVLWTALHAHLSLNSLNFFLLFILLLLTGHYFLFLIYILYICFVNIILNPLIILYHTGVDFICKTAEIKYNILCL